jgi:site-specific recombinase XerD
MKTSDLGQLLPRYFTEHLVGQRDLSTNTVAAYRDTFRLFSGSCAENAEPLPRCFL